MSSADAQVALLEALGRAVETERALALATAALGALAVVAAMVCWFIWARPAALGAALPLALLGVITGVAGAQGFAWSSRELQALPDTVREAPHRLADEMLPRVEAALADRRVLQLADALLLLLGLGLVTRTGRLRGAGVALALMAALNLGLDALAVEQAHERVRLLEPLRAAGPGAP